MRKSVDAEALLAHAGAARAGSIERTLWIVALLGSVLDRRVVLIGGAAHNLYTGEYRPTSIAGAADGVGHTEFERLGAAGLTDLGLGHRHLELWFGETEPPELIEFPTDLSDIESTDVISLTETVSVEVISLPELVVDRLIQATDGSLVTFEDAVALGVAAATEIDWLTVSRIVDERYRDPMLGELPSTLRLVRTAVEAAPG
jgi:hypothetical protein